MGGIIGLILLSIVLIIIEITQSIKIRKLEKKNLFLIERSETLSNTLRDCETSLVKSECTRRVLIHYNDSFQQRLNSVYYSPSRNEIVSLDEDDLILLGEL